MEECFVISIEDPLRTESSHKDDFWYSISDVGKEFHGKILTWAEFTRVEALYIETVKKMLGGTEMKPFQVRLAQKIVPRERASEEDKKVVAEIMMYSERGEIVPAERFTAFLRANLRRDVWCQFDWEDGSRLRHLGDFFTAVACPLAQRDYLITSEHGDIEFERPSELRVCLHLSEWYLVESEEDGDDEEYYDEANDEELQRERDSLSEGEES